MTKAFVLFFLCTSLVPKFVWAWEFTGSDLFQDGLAKDSSGQYLRMTQSEALKYCASRGMRLPNNRDFAKFAVLFGALVEETSMPNQPITRELVKAEIESEKRRNFFPVYGFSDQIGLFVDFYYNRKDFKAPSFIPNVDGFMSATKDAQWESEHLPWFESDPIPDTFNTAGFIEPRTYRLRYVTCTKN